MNIHILLVIIIFVLLKVLRKKLFRTCSLNYALTKSDQEGNPTVGIKTYIRFIIKFILSLVHVIMCMDLSIRGLFGNY